MFSFFLLLTMHWLDHWEDIPLSSWTIQIEIKVIDSTIEVLRCELSHIQEFSTFLDGGCFLFPPLQKKRWKNLTVENGSGVCVCPPAGTVDWAPGRALALVLSASKPWRPRDVRSLATGRSSLEVSLTLCSYCFNLLFWNTFGTILSNSFSKPTHVYIKLNKYIFLDTRWPASFPLRFSTSDIRGWIFVVFVLYILG